MDDSRWHIMRVKPGQEKAVALLSGVPAYVPSQRVEYYNRKMRKVVRYVKALIPGFVFLLLRAPSDLNWFPPADVFGFLRNGDRTPAVLTEKAFEALRKVEQEANVVAEPPPQETAEKKVIKAGDQVSVRMAQFSEAVTALVKEVQGNRVVAMIIKSQMRVVLDARAI